MNELKLLGARRNETPCLGEIGKWNLVCQSIMQENCDLILGDPGVL